jgi:hypothetical protein
MNLKSVDSTMSINRRHKSSVSERSGDLQQQLHTCMRCVSCCCWCCCCYSFAVDHSCSRDKHALREALSQATADADARAHKCDQLSAALRSLERERELQQQKALEEREQQIAAADMRLLQARADLEDTQEREAQLRREVLQQPHCNNANQYRCVFTGIGPSGGAG